MHMPGVLGNGCGDVIFAIARNCGKMELMWSQSWVCLYFHFENIKNC